MSYVTQMIGNESGIQYQGVSDQTNVVPANNMTNMLMLVENIPRGRLDTSMTVTSENVKKILGVEKDNLYLQAVEDALNTGVPSIQVFRIGQGAKGNQISCDGASSSVRIQLLRQVDYGSSNNVPTIIFDGVEYDVSENPPFWLSFSRTEDLFTGPIPEGFERLPFVEIWTNNDSVSHRIELKTNNPDLRLVFFDNPSVIELGVVDGMHVGFCLSASVGQ